MTNSVEPLVSIIMNCLNGSKYVRAAIDSIYAQTYKNWEIIFWDNGSTDNSSQIASSFDTRVKLFKTEGTVSLGKARNRAIKKAKGEFIAFLDVDDLWLKTKLEKQIPLFKNPEVGLVYCDSIIKEEKLEYCQFDVVSPHRGEIAQKLLEDNFMTTISMVFRREALLEQAQIYRNEFSLMMDYDLSIRVALNWKSDYINEALVKCIKHGENLSQKKKELFIEEGDNLIKTLISENSNLKNHKDSIYIYKSRQNMLKVEIYLEQKNLKGAKKLLSCEKNKSAKNYLIYMIICLFPNIKIYRFFQYIWRVYSKMIKIL